MSFFHFFHYELCTFIMQNVDLGRLIQCIFKNINGTADITTLRIIFLHTNQIYIFIFIVNYRVSFISFAYIYIFPFFLLYSYGRLSSYYWSRIWNEVRVIRLVFNKMFERLENDATYQIYLNSKPDRHADVGPRELKKKHK